jgi:trehalose 6-phosphate phosphatase
MLSLTPVAEKAGWALFLDVDGTLLEIAETPHDVHVPATLKALLSELQARLDGAVALISGRGLYSLDRLFAPLQFCASGVHGCERRAADGRVFRPTLDQHKYSQARHSLLEFAHRHEGLLLEDKRYGLAMHFRRAPHLSTEVYEVMSSTLQQLGPDYALQPGKLVLELHPAAWTKGASVAEFMRESPFLNRTPIYIGDDVTDEHAFAAVNKFGGVSIRVGESTETLAQHRLAGVPEVIRWLQSNPPMVPRP